MIKLTTEQFVEKARIIFEDKYDYSHSKYEHSLKKIEVICPQHGSFFIKPSNHINNKQGCPECGKKKPHDANRTTLEELLTKIKIKFNNKFNCSRIKNFDNLREHVDIECPIHGWFNIEIRDLLRSQNGCKQCAKNLEKHTLEEFVNLAKIKHNNNYDYSKVNYINAHTEVVLVCRKHGEFLIKPYIHLAGNGCSRCYGFVSIKENQLFNFMKQNKIDVQGPYRKLKGIKEVDLISLDKKIAIEFNGCYWHSDLFKKNNYHLEKTNALKEQGYRLIHIFEDEWINKKEIVQSMILNVFGKTPNKIHARKCVLKNVDSKIAKKFLNDNHIQGNVNSKIKIGLFYENELVSLMTFGQNRICLGSKAKENEYELIRFCNKVNTVVIGGASKLFSYFIDFCSPKKIISYCDIRYATGNLYEKLGFIFVNQSKPNYFYTKGGKRFNRFNFTKYKLVSLGYDKDKTESQIMAELGYNRIYDCGCKKFQWESK